MNAGWSSNWSTGQETFQNKSAQNTSNLPFLNMASAAGVPGVIGLSGLSGVFPACILQSSKVLRCLVFFYNFYGQQKASMWSLGFPHKRRPLRLSRSTLSSESVTNKRGKRGRAAASTRVPSQCIPQRNNMSQSARGEAGISFVLPN